ncbi:hypothetical protein AMAG_04968 [Allomyces macrogynus ATCC 38327]|uniref:Non-specific serine/threonine protein kinase n=1 Tax=Allomyces macrogynus (strain ATCC 38327) TaxID=578462 RepID=A0A0L0S6C7_ALLM3|nr:hypothetical protein AMAG_04968 [Allomyces macrogynus ATCC 38327]|eukprot:KNE58153.1 hypothetical protein AMAG_04968 [Allomyces macrogynus ATCC 38327]
MSANAAGAAPRAGAPAPPPPSTESITAPAPTMTTATTNSDAMDTDPPATTSATDPAPAGDEPPAALVQLAERLLQATDVTDRLPLVAKVRDELDTMMQDHPQHWVNLMVPALIHIMNTTEPVMEALAPVQRLRSHCLDVLQRVQLTEAFRPHVENLMQMLFGVLERDNEENGQTALKVVMEISRIFKSVCEPQVGPFLQLVTAMYASMQATVARVFDNATSSEEAAQEFDLDAAMSGAASDAASAASTPAVTRAPRSEPPLSPKTASSSRRKSSASTTLMPALNSFKVLMDCPIIVVMLIQTHKKFAKTDLPQLLRVAIDALQVQPAAQAAAHAAAQIGHTELRYHIGRAKAITQMQQFTDLIVCQVKTVSFLAYIVRGYEALCTEYMDRIPPIIIQLLCNLPSDAASTRKELLVATRHIWSTSFRAPFAAHVDQLLSEEIMIGTGMTGRDLLRPIAWNMVADFLHGERDKLTMRQILAAIELFCKNLHDPSFTHTALAISVKLLVTLQEAVVSTMTDRSQARVIVLHILSVFCAKIVSLSHYLAKFRAPNRVTLSSAMRVRTLSAGSAAAADRSDSPAAVESAARARSPGEAHEAVRPLSSPPPFQSMAGVSSTGAAPLRAGSVSSSAPRSSPAPPASLGHGGTDSPPIEPADLPEHPWEIDFEASRPIKTSRMPQQTLAQMAPTTTREQDLQQEKTEIRFLLRHLIGHLRYIVHTLRLCSTPPAPPTGQPQPAPLLRAQSPAEVNLFRTLLRASLQCFEYYWMDIPNNNLGAPGQDIIFTKMGTSAKEEKEILDQLSSVFVLVDPALFHEVFASQIDFLFECMTHDTSLVAVPQFLLSVEHFSAKFNSLLLGYLMSRLEDLGKGDTLLSAIHLRQYKLVFNAVTHYPDQNERVLHPHLTTMIMQCLQLSTTAKEPSNYFLLLRAMFRAIGGGRFELLYKEVLPLLPVLLTHLNHFLTVAHTPQMKELFVELCLTVPVRLSVLLPHLSHLMRPLVLALQSGPELVSQGLRTLELCIDNLTQEFLDPIMAPVIDDLMQALWRHLRPLPYNQQHAHATMRILGKLGGRNRKRMKWALPSPEGLRHLEPLGFQVPVTMNGGMITVKVDMGDLVMHALSILDDATANDSDREHVFRLLRHVVEDAQLDVDARILGGIFRAAYRGVADAMEYLRDVTVRYRTHAKVGHFLDAVVTVMTSANHELRPIGKAAVEHFFEGNTDSDHAAAAFQQFALKFCSCCFRDGWYGQGGGSLGIATCVRLPVPTAWLVRFELDFIRALLYMLKSPDTIHETPRVQETLNQLLKICNRPDADADRMDVVVEAASTSNVVPQETNSGADAPAGGAENGTAPRLNGEQSSATTEPMDVDSATANGAAAPGGDTASSAATNANGVVTEAPEPVSKSRFQALISLLILELASSSKQVRETVQAALQLLADLTGKEVTELLLPCKDRLLEPIYSRPLRALPLPMQIGNTDAIKYCLSLRPPLLEFTTELNRMLTEALALADAEDSALVHKILPVKHSASPVDLRIVCIQLLSAAMACGEFQSQRQSTMRTRIIAVFFKRLYHRSQDVVDAANKAMHQVLSQGSKLPKELLQNGLKPILSTLADHNRLSVLALEGLGRLLELLTNYFKVEIGRKLLDHLRAWSTQAVLEACSIHALADVNEIRIITALLDVFSQLPPQANVFMDDLVKEVTRMETLLRRSQASPFRKSLAKYMVRYTVDAVSYFLARVHELDTLQLFVGLLQLEQSTALRAETAKHVDQLVTLVGPDGRLRPEVCEILHVLHRHGLDVLTESVFAVLAKLPVNHTHTYTQTNQQVVELYCAFFAKLTRRLEAMFTVCAWMTKFPNNYLKVYIQQQLNAMAFKLSWAELDAVLFNVIEKLDEPCTVVMRHVVLPSFMVLLIKNRDAPQLNEELWKKLVELKMEQIPELLALEFYQLFGFAIKLTPEHIAPHWRTLLRSVWPNAKSSELSLKHATHVLIAVITAAYRVPSRIVYQIFMSLIKAYQVETRVLVRQALDTVVPVLPQRIDGSDDWVRALKKSLTEDVTIPHLAHLLQTMTTHIDIFYPERDQFYHGVASALPKLSASAGASPETRHMALQVVRMIIQWEQRRLQPSILPRKRSADDMEVDTDVVPPPADPHGGLSQMAKDSVMTSLLRISFLPETAAQRGGASGASRAVELMREIMALIPDATIKLALLEKPITQYPIQEETIPIFMRATEILALVIEFGHDPTLGAETYRLATRAFKSDTALVFLPTLQTYFSQLFKIDGLDPVIVQDITAHLHDLLNSGERLPLAVAVLDILVGKDASVLSPFLPDLVRNLQKLVVGHLTAERKWSQRDNDTCLKTTIKLLNMRLSQLPSDQRRSCVGMLVQLVEKSADVDLCRFLLDLCREWVLTDSLYPSVKDKSTLLVKMMAFEHKGSPELMNNYLRLVAAVLVQKSEVSSRLEHAFLLGTRAPTAEVRNLFIDILNESLPADLMTRLDYIFSSQNWEPLAITYYIHQPLDVLLGAMDIPAPVHAAFSALHHHRPDFAHTLWTKLFVAAWTALAPKERQEMSKSMLSLLTRDYHHRQSELNPNIISTVLDGIARCRPLPKLAPHVIKYLGKTFNAWHSATEILTVSQLNLGGTKEEDRLRDSTLDALAELLTELNETDLCTGLWRRRCQYPETNAALSFQQIGYWQRAQAMYEQAQAKGRTGTLAFTESEYCLWEEQWVRCCQKLQQWDVLEEVGKTENRHDLILEAVWRLGDWTSGGKDKVEVESLLQHLPEDPRSKVFRAFVALNKLADRKELEDKMRVQEFQNICDEGVQMALKKWFLLPHAIGDCHLPLLALFQQFVELVEALQIYTSLSNTTLQNHEQRSQELKAILQTWRERLPNVWDDIDVWSDLVAWRQHIFGAINKAYFPILTSMSNTTNNSSPYRGYHETAWIINRFAHVARLHDLTSVCIQYLPKIYALPNIEIQEAFLKLREQAKCYLSNPEDYKTGLDVITNTNLVYFNPQQKAEFFGLKAKFLALLGNEVEANKAFVTAVTTDHHLAKSWAMWGEYHEQLFRQSGEKDLEMSWHTLNCYLHTIGLFKSGKARRYIARVLWLLANQDKTNYPLTENLEGHKNDLAIWYWVTFIPQLLNMLIDPHQTRHAQFILMQIANFYPQALHFLLRTQLEEVGSHQAVEEVMAKLKTVHPLLALSMETMVDQMIARLKPLPQEEMYRYVVACLNEMVDHVCSTVGANGELAGDAASLPTKSLNKLSEHFAQSPALKQYHDQFKRDFIDGSPDLLTIIDRFRIWRDALQRELDEYRVPEHLTHYLIEFEHQRLDDIEIPGQYLALVDSPQNFVRIARFRPEIERIRLDGTSHRGIQIIGHDGSTHAFLVQQPAPSMYRREERVVQLFGYLNSILDRSKESRKRGIQFHFPTMVPLAPNVRMISYDPSYTSLEQVWASHCQRIGIPKDHAIMYYLTRLQDKQSSDLTTKMAVLDEIRRQFAPADLLERQLLDQVHNFTDLWMLRKQFTQQMATVCFMSYAMAIALRYPQSLHISTTTGHIWMSEALPSVNQHTFTHFERVPFRLTPVLQHFMTPHGMDGPFSASMLAIAKALCLDGHNLEIVQDFMRIIVRDELLYWANCTQQAFASDEALRSKVVENCAEITDRMRKLVDECAVGSSSSSSANAAASTDRVDPVNRQLLELVGRATNPQCLAEMSITWMPFL